MQYLIDRLNKLPTPLFAGIRRGIEREGLRVTAQGLPAQTPHPASLGSKLTHPYITTDYSENLIELITPPCTSVSGLLKGMRNTHQFVEEQLKDEWIWPQSLPCPLIGEIPIANYGTSTAAQQKMRYRRGLGLRYGKAMQTIAGLHFNFSLPQTFWETWYQHIDPAHDSIQACIDTQYFHMIRQHMRHVWILAYLFGASSAIDKTLLQDKTASYLKPFDDSTFIAPNACSLRLTPLGYYAQTQTDHLSIRFDSLAEYIADLRLGLSTPYPPYQKLAEQFGEDAQLNTHLLQIENEFYHPIRPKRLPKPGETALEALSSRGVEYIEIRSIDINPFEPTGISTAQLLFLDVYLIYCLIKPSPVFMNNELKSWQTTLHRVAYEGRKPGLEICYDNKMQPLSQVLKHCFDEFRDIAILLDRESGEDSHLKAVQHFQACIDSPEQLLSAQYDRHLYCVGHYTEAGMLLAKQHKDTLTASPLSPETLKIFQEQVVKSFQ